MQIWVHIFVRELAMLLTLLALGSGPASLLGQRFGAAARLAIAPVLGLCVGTCVFTTLIWFTAADDTYWLVPVLALISLAVALQRGMTSAAYREKASYTARAVAMCRSVGVFDAVALAVVCVVVAMPLSYTLHERHSVGPTGLAIWDADDYTAEADAMDQMSILQAHQPQPPGASFERLIWSSYSKGTQNMDAAPLSANVNALLGLGATDTQSLFLIMFLTSGALGAFAAVRYFAPKPRWAALLAGLLFAGPFFLQLMADGSQAAICGLAVLLPIAAVGADALRARRFATLIPLALLISGLMALYPLFIPGVAVAMAVVLIIVGAGAWWRGRLTRGALAWTAGAIGALLLMTVLFDVVSFSRDVRYWRGLLEGAYFIEGLPVYHLPYSVLPGWLLQTREFYGLSELGSTSFHEVLIGVILPILFICVIVSGLKRNRAALLLIPLLLIYAAQALYTSSSHACSYCTDRALLPVAPLSIALLALGVAALVTAPSRWLRWSGAAVAIVALIAVAARTGQERRRVADDGYFLDAGNGGLLSRLPSHAGTVDLEGYGEYPSAAPGEFPLVYFLASERNHEQVSVPTEYDNYSALAYPGGPNPANPQFDPSYQYVLTRFGGVHTGRAVIARSGSLALEERTAALDASVVSGVQVPPLRLDAPGLASVVGPLHMLLVGGASTPAWISLRFRTLVPVTVAATPGVTSRVTPGFVTACVLALGTPPVRRGTIELDASLLPALPSAEPFALPEPPRGIQLVAMKGVTSCSVGGTP